MRGTMTMLLLGLLLVAGVARAEALTPVEDKPVLALLQMYEEFSPASAGARTALRVFDTDRVASAVAFALGQPEYRLAALDYLRYELPDPRLVPFLADAIRAARDAQLQTAVAAARALPDRALLPALLEVGLASPYQRIYQTTADEFTEWYYISVFAETAEVLNIISKGAIGVQEAPRTREWPATPEERFQLIGRWRVWWEQEQAA